jgi:UDP:flavonoid glycosyltransferase YjiC (YdhE family)
VRRLFDDPEYAERAGRIRDWSEGHDGAELAADAIEEIAAAGYPAVTHGYLLSRG